MIPIGGWLTIDHIPSVNSMYERGRRGQVRLTKEARNYKDHCKEQLIKCNLKLTEYDPNKPFILTLLFILNNRIGVRDLDNMEKLTIDAIYEVLEINDATVYEKHTFKMLSNKTCEIIRYTIEQSDKNFNQYEAIC